jgi:acyl carrier protein
MNNKESKNISKSFLIGSKKYNNLDSIDKIKILVKIEKKLKYKLTSNEAENIFKNNYKNFAKKLNLILKK